MGMFILRAETSLDSRFKLDRDRSKLGTGSKLDAKRVLKIDRLNRCVDVAGLSSRRRGYKILLKYLPVTRQTVPLLSAVVWRLTVERTVNEARPKEDIAPQQLG